MNVETKRMPTDVSWLLFWLGGSALLIAWDGIFLNTPALLTLMTSFFNSVAAGFAAVCGAFLLGWTVATVMHAVDLRRLERVRMVVAFAVNMIRSVPQILGVLAGYVALTYLIRTEILLNRTGQLLFIAGSIAVVLSPDVVSLISDRISYYVRHDFVPALRCCGMSEQRIVNIEILWRNSRSHILHAAIALFGSALFLQCSVDFIVSVGLAKDVSLSNFPATLGGLLARLDSKQDVLAIGKAFSDPSYLPFLAVRHLQGISTAFLIIFSLLCVHKAGNAFMRRKGL